MNMCKSIKTRMATIIESEAQEIRWSDEDRMSANIIEYHILSILIFLRIIISKLRMIKQLFHLKSQ